MKNPNINVNKSTRRKWLKRILITLAVIILLPLGLFTIGWLSRDTVIDVLQDWYLENNTGTLTIGKVNASFFSGFPKVGFTLKDIRQTNKDTISDQFTSIQIEEAKLVIGAGNLLKGDIKFETISIKNAVIASEVISKKSLNYHQQLKRDRHNKRPNGFKLPAWINQKGTKFFLYNVKYNTKDSILNKHFNLDIHKIKGAFKESNLNLSGDAFLDITVNNLGFNTKKGSFFNGARVTGNPKFTIDLKNDLIEIPEFILNIDKQKFNINAHFDLSESNSYIFKLQNPYTDFKAVKNLLPDSLAVKLKNYNIQNPIQTSFNLAGKFAYGNNPDINLEFSTKDNFISIADKLHFKNTSLSGSLTNDIYATDNLRLAKRSRKDIKIIFNSINATLEDIKVDVANAYYQSTPETLNFIEANISLKGNNESLAKIIDTDNFDFNGGTFQFDATISGDIPNPYQFLNKATGNFNINNTRVILKKNGLQLPIQTINLSLKKENSILKQLIINLPNDDNVVLTGSLKNISSLLSKNPKEPTSSRIYLDSESLNINEVITMAKRFVPKSDKEINDRKNLHETLKAIYGQFHPRFEINLESMQYNDVTINDLNSDIELTDSNTILMRNFDFRYFDALTNLKGSVIVPNPDDQLKDAIYMNAEASSSGSIAVIKELFDIQLFRIDSGNYSFHGTVKGNVKRISELLNKTRGDLTLTNTKLHYAPAEMDIDVDSLALFVDNSNILLKKFNIEIDELSPMNFNGSIKNFPSFLLDNSSDLGSIFLKVTAPFIDLDKGLVTIKSLKNEEKIKNPKDKKALHKIFKDINKFNPEIELAIDSLKYNDLITEDIKALMYFENDSILKLVNLDLKYNSTNAKINGTIKSHISLDSLYNSPFDIDFSVNVKGKSNDLNDYLKTTNFIFESGDFEFIGNYKALSADLDILNSKSFGDLKLWNTLVDFKPADLQIPVDSLHIKINNDEATLKTLNINLPGKSSVNFSGSINNFSAFIDGSIDNNIYNSNFSIYSPYLNTLDLKEFLETSKTNKIKANDNDLNLKKFKGAMLNINNSFYPTLGIKIDTLRHKDFSLTNFGLDLLFDNKGNIKIEDTHLNFYGGSIALNMDVGIKNDIGLPVVIDMQANEVDIHELVTRFDYFNDDELRQVEKIEGNLNFKIKANGTLADDGQLNMESLNGTLQLEVQNFEIFNYKPIMENSLLMKDERFKNLRFRPIVQTFEIKNGEILIPRTEIQSTAIQVFVEGKLKLKDYMDIWLSIPYKNLKNNEGSTLPEKTSFEDAGSKFYVQLLKGKTSEQSGKQKLKFKVRLSNRKLRKQKERERQ